MFAGMSNINRINFGFSGSRFGFALGFPTRKRMPLFCLPSQDAWPKITLMYQRTGYGKTAKLAKEACESSSKLGWHQCLALALQRVIIKSGGNNKERGIMRVLVILAAALFLFTQVGLAQENDTSAGGGTNPIKAPPNSVNIRHPAGAPVEDPDIVQPRPVVPPRGGGGNNKERGHHESSRHLGSGTVLIHPGRLGAGK
jgi:hypothetical protein